MSKDELIAEILRLPANEQRSLIADVMDQLPDSDMTPQFRAELERRYQDMLEHPERESSWEEVSARLLARKPQS